MTDFHIRPDCRLCGGSYHEVLRLPDTPLANEYLDTAEASLAQDRFPLYLVECDDCGHFQLPVVVNPERLFRNYAYQSGTSPVFREHLRELARATAPSKGELVVDIASNDGSLLKEYKHYGCDVVGVDPARNLAEKATAEGVFTVPEFFTPEIAREIRGDHGPAKLITALNVMAHVDDLHGIVEGVRELLADDGTFIFEVGYFPDVCRKGLFDTIYHEHLSYHHISPLRGFFQRHDMHIRLVRVVESQGGSMRVFVGKGPAKSEPAACPLAELDKPDVENLKVRMGTLSTALEWLDYCARDEGLLTAFGVPAKLTTLFAAAPSLKRSVFWVYDDNPLKVGKYIPGTRLQIEASKDLLLDPPSNPCVIFSWNFADEIMQRLRKQGFKGRFIVPLPELRVYG